VAIKIEEREKKKERKGKKCAQRSSDYKTSEEKDERERVWAVKTAYIYI